MTLGVKEEAFRAGGKKEHHDFGTDAPVPRASQCDGVGPITDFEVHQFDYKTEEAKQTLLIGLFTMRDKENHGTLKDTESGLSGVGSSTYSAHWEIAE